MGLVRRAGHGRRGTRGGVGRQRAADQQAAFAAQFRDGPGGHVGREGLAVPALVVLDLREPASLDGAGQYHRGLAGSVLRDGAEGLVDAGEVVAVDSQHPRAECLGALLVGGQVPLQLGGAALAQPVDVDDRGQVGQLVIPGLVQGLPDGALSHLAVPAQHPHPVREPVEVPARQRYPHPVGQALAQRSGGDVDPRQHRGGVAFQAGPEPPVPGHQLFVGHHPHRLVDGVQQRGRVSLREDQVVVMVRARVVPVVVQVTADQHRQQVRGGHAGGGMPGSGTRAGPDGVHPELCGEVGGHPEVDPCKRLGFAAHVRPFFLQAVRAKALLLAHREVTKLVTGRPAAAHLKPG